MEGNNSNSLLFGINFALSQAVIYVPFYLCFFFGATFISKGTATYGDVVKTVLVLYFAILYIGMSQKYVADLQKANQSLINIVKIKTEFSKLDPLLQSPNLIRNKDIKGKIEFRNVTFGYPSREKLILKNVSFKILPGQFSAFVGHSGSGKSTIIQLLERFYDLINEKDNVNYEIDGTILIDDIDIRNYDVNFLRSFISLVGQEPALFKRSVKDNILYGKLEASDYEVIKAAQFAKIDHLLDNDGSQLPVSGGEKQRIAIARAVIRDPKIVLLDEATSALDKTKEIEIQESLDKMMEKRTSVVVAHR